VSRCGTTKQRPVAGQDGSEDHPDFTANFIATSANALQNVLFTPPMLLKILARSSKERLLTGGL
jgi:hypothetical protein